MSFFHGLSAFPLTPTDGSGRVNTNELSVLLERLVEAKVDSIGLLGSTGGYAYLARAERKRALEAAVETVAERVPIMVGVGSIRTDEAQALARDAHHAGADGLLLAPVSYLPLLEDEAYQHYQSVAETTGLPLCIYNNPGTTHFNFSMELLQRLSHLDNIVAVKMPAAKNGDFKGEIAELREGCADGFAVGYSADHTCSAAMIAGADTWHSAIGGVLPVPFLKLCRAAQAGDEMAVADMDGAFQPLWALLKDFGSMRVAYTIANTMGLTNAQPHLPVLPLGQTDRQRVEVALSSLGDLI